MADPRDTEEQRRAARIKRTEEAVEETKKMPGLAAKTPEEAAERAKLAQEMDKNQRDFHRSLMQPKPPGSGGKGR
jgi:hypothetical protein